MKKMLFLVAILGAGLLQTATFAAGPSESVAVYQLTDFQGKISYEVLTKPQFTALNALLREEATTLQQVLPGVKKAWEADKSNKGPFPGARIKARTIQKQRECPTKEMADKVRGQLEDRLLDKETAKSKQKKSDADLEKENQKLSQLTAIVTTLSEKMSEKLQRKVSAAGFTVNELSGEKEPLPEGGAVAAPAAAGGAPANPASPFGAPKKEEKAAH